MDLPHLIDVSSQTPQVSTKEHDLLGHVLVLIVPRLIVDLLRQQYRSLYSIKSTRELCDRLANSQSMCVKRLVAPRRHGGYCPDAARGSRKAVFSIHECPDVGRSDALLMAPTPPYQTLVGDGISCSDKGSHRPPETLL